MFLRLVAGVAFMAMTEAADCIPGDNSCSTDQEEAGAMKMSMLQKRDIKAHSSGNEINELEARKAAIIAELGDLEIEIGAMHAEERLALLQGNINSTEKLRGHCTSADETAMANKGNGHEPGTFPFITSECGKASYSVWWGFNQENFATCVQKDVPGMGKSCSQCLAKHANYMTDNCKWACLTNWCAASCLACSANDEQVMRACTGEDAALPTTDPC
jgi:hypothetical protein